MGRTVNTARRAPHSAIILYGRSRASIDSTANKTTQTASDLPSDNRSQTQSSSNEKKESLEKRTITNKTYFKPTYVQEKATAQTVASMAVDVLSLFEQVPYVSVITGLIEQIIKISDEIESNKDRSKQLIAKVMIYAKVVFDALLGLDEQTAIGLKHDLEDLAAVLESIHGVLQEMTGPNQASLISRLVYRNEIASMLAEQDRNLDTTITAFQLKCAIINRSGKERVESKIKEIPTLSPAASASLTLGLRSKPQIFYGRTKEIDLIITSLQGSADVSQATVSPPKLCILGPGGIGKTTLALSVVHHELVVRQYQEKRYFVSCEAASSVELLLNQLASSLRLAVEELKVSLLEAILAHLRKTDCLLVIDNFETAWDPLHTRSQVEGVLSDISALPTVTLLVTMRGSQQPAGTRWTNVIPPLLPVDLESAISIFTDISHKNDKYAVDLVRAVDCVPLAVTLLANLAAVDGETTEALWARWEAERTSMVENGQDRLSSLEASIRLSLNGPRMQKDPSASHLLSTLSLLPDGVSPATLLACENNLPEVQSVKKAISTLRQNALIYEDANKDLRILSPIRLLMCARHPPSNKCRSFIHEHFINLALKGTQYQDPPTRSQLQREVNNISAVLMYMLNDSKENLFRVVEAVINFCHFTYVAGYGTTQYLSLAIEKLENVKPATISAEPAVLAAPKPKKVWQRSFVGFGQSKVAKPIPSVISKDTGASVVQIATALQLRADCLGCFGQILNRQSQFDQAREKFELAKELHIQSGDQSAHAYDLLNIGLIYSRNFDTLPQALDTVKEALNLHNNLGDATGKAYDLLGLGHVYQDLCQFEEAEDQFELAAQIFKELDDLHGQAAAMNGLGATLVSVSAFEPAAKYFKNAINLCQNLGDIVGEAENLGGLATTLLLRSRFPEALETIERALALRQPFEDPEHLHILGRIFIAMDRYKEAKAALERSLSIQKDIGNTRGQAANLLYLGYIEFDQGSCSDAQALAEQALAIPNNSLVEADINILLAITNIRLLNFSEAKEILDASAEEFTDAGHTLGEAYCLYTQGLLFLRRGQFGNAVVALGDAITLHQRVGNVQGHADDLNKICEALLSRGNIEDAMTLSAEALALHIQIGDRRGQGDDLLIQASLFLAQGRLTDAEKFVRHALELHSAAESIYGMAKDNALLGYILWQRMHGTERAVQHMQTAMSLFQRLGAVGEITECKNQILHMKQDIALEKIEVSAWVPLETDASVDYDSDDSGYYDFDDDDDDNEGDGKSNPAWVPLFPVYVH
ncbi:hypothetical protein JR316_0010100 [Psilocybe cubensis]|uniref:Uncharacterized protein n=2 Tax=Psilocybe cubensis TaxID=181762 RepID=A0ACB8GQQ3_PSICU|nr:hypothetical protein JR316_0010100 [Psilocybe cubensis]KAH9477868.1 hypothetical protein JR316_0010100 [Psilocybe cubensis]